MGRDGENREDKVGETTPRQKNLGAKTVWVHHWIYISYYALEVKI